MITDYFIDLLPMLYDTIVTLLVKQGYKEVITGHIQQFLSLG